LTPTWRIRFATQGDREDERELYFYDEDYTRMTRLKNQPQIHADYTDKNR
jgi:hypothetical protein